MSNKKKKPESEDKSRNTPAAEKRPVRLRMFYLIPVVLVLLAGAGFLLFRKKIQPGSYRDYNVMLITLDTTRADRLPMYGYDQVETPALDRLAGGSIVFESALSHVPLTLPSHTSMLTGVLPISHGVRDNAGYFLDLKATTLTEILKANGYQTSAFVSAFVLDSRWQLSQGFDLYYDNFNLEEFKQLNPQDAQRKAEETEVEVEHWLDAHKDQKFFSWVHFYDPHDPYDPPEPFLSRYSGRPYDGEIAYMDSSVGKLLDKIKALGLAEKTIVVVTGDHGEGLGQHSEITHAMFVYNSTQHVPFLIHVPGGSSGRVKSVVRHIDLAPTILDLLGIPADSEMQGSSLISLMNGKEDKLRVAYSESMYAELHYGWSPLKSVTTEQYKYIEAPEPELYDRIADPDETRNLVREKANYAKVLHDQLNELIAKYSSKTLSGPQKMDPETEERLRALGYISGTVESTAESRKIDPKEKIHLASALQVASSHTQSQRYKEAIDVLIPVLQEDPEMTDAHFIAGVSYIGLKEYDNAVHELLQTLALRSDHTMALYNIGYSYELKGDRQEALKWFLKVLQYEPKHLYASLKIAHMYRNLNLPDRARPYFLQAMEVYTRFLENTRSDRAKSALHSTVGEIYFGAGDVDNAEKHFDAAIDLTPDRKTLHYNLAMIYESKGNLVKAVDAYRKEAEVDPENFKAFNNLGLLYRQAGQFDQAAICFQRVVQLLPKDPRGYILLASVYKQMGRNAEAEDILRQIGKPAAGGS